MSSRGGRRSTYNEATGDKVNVKAKTNIKARVPLNKHPSLTQHWRCSRPSLSYTDTFFHAPPALSPDMQGTLLACCSAKLPQVLCWFKLWLSLGNKPCGLIKEKIVDIWWSLRSDGMQKLTLECPLCYVICSSSLKLTPTAFYFRCIGTLFIFPWCQRVTLCIWMWRQLAWQNVLTNWVWEGGGHSSGPDWKCRDLQCYRPTAHTIIII